MRYLEHRYDLVIIGAGITGIAAALTAARNGVNVALVQDRPVLGGNSSKEIRVPVVGARCCNFAYSKETGLVEEMLLENLYRNPTGSPEGWHLVLTNLVKQQPHLDLFLNTVILQVDLNPEKNQILTLRGFTLAAETWHNFSAPLFADCTGDGTIGVMAGNPWRMGIEAESEFGEATYPEHQDFGMGTSTQFRTRDAGRPVPFHKPEWVKLSLNDEDFNKSGIRICDEFLQQKGGFWWMETGGDRDTVHDTEAIRDGGQELVYAVWDYLKNRSPIHTQIQNYELDWVGAIPGKRESRRLVGRYILSEQDIAGQRYFEDAVAYGGWGFDDHPKEGFFSKVGGRPHMYHKGPYNIPLRSLVSANIDNLMFAGRNLSATHRGLSSTRVMLTCGQLGEAVGAAATTCTRANLLAGEVVKAGWVKPVQRLLQEQDHYIHDLPYDSTANLASSAHVLASSELASPDCLDFKGFVPLDQNRLLQFPIVNAKLDCISILAGIQSPTVLKARLHQGAKNGSTFPEGLIWTGEIKATAGNSQWLSFTVNQSQLNAGWYFLELEANPEAVIYYGQDSPVGVLGYDVRPYDPGRINEYSNWKVFRAAGAADIWNVEDGKLKVKTVDPNAGMLADYYCFRLSPAQAVYAAENVTNPWSRPGCVPNLWISAPTDFSSSEWLELRWQQAQAIRSIHLLFDSALDFHVTSMWMEYSRNTIPSIVKDYRLLAEDKHGAWVEIASVKNNYFRRRVHAFETHVTKAIRIEIMATNGLARAQIYSVRVYA